MTPAAAIQKYLRLLGFLRGFKLEVAGKILIGLLNAAAGFGLAFMIARTVGAVFQRLPLIKVIPSLAGVLGIILFRAFLLRYHEGYAKKMAARIKGSIRNVLLDKLMLLGPAYQGDKRSGNVQALLTDGVESLEAFLVNYVPQTAVVFLSILGIVGFVMTLDMAVGIIILAASILSILIPHFFMPAINRVMIEYWQDYAYLNAQYIESMQGMSTLKAFHASRRKLTQLRDDADRFAKSSIKNTGISLADSALITLCGVVGASISVAIAAGHTANGALPATSLLTILFLTGECMKPLGDLNSYWHSSYLGFSVAEQLYAVLDAEMTLTQPAGEGKKFSHPLPSVEFRGVTFRYTEDAKPALDDVTLSIPAGESIAVVGKSGSGKSTMVNLLLRYFDVNRGSILIDGFDARDYNLDYLRGAIAVVFQDTYLFYGTVKENLLMAKPDAAETEIVSAAKAAGAHNFIAKLPQGYDTVMGERGATLSGGERQRIAIARAVLKDAPILILDEATSSVDVASEKEIQQALANLMKGRTAIIIAHRLSTVIDAKRIFVLEDGKLREQGGHEELIKKDGVYARLVRIQNTAGNIV